MQKPIYPFYAIWANYVLKVEISNALEQIKNLKVKTSEDVAGFYQNGFHHHLEKTGDYRRSQKHGKSQTYIGFCIDTLRTLNIIIAFVNVTSLVTNEG